MDIPLWRVDAFTDTAFAGNPAAVCLLGSWPDDARLQHVAAEMNLSETAFLVREGADWRLRWFTPRQEVEICGHATVAAARVLFGEIEPARREVAFASRSGPLAVRQDGDLFVLDFPARPPRPIATPPDLAAALGTDIRETWLGRDYLAVLESAAAVRTLTPDLAAVAALERTAVMVTAASDEPGIDFVSRFFAPAKGVPEDPVTGSSHLSLVPLWAARLGRSQLVARQVSPRGGTLWCTHAGDRVHLGGRAVLVFRGRLSV